MTLPIWPYQSKARIVPLQPENDLPPLPPLATQ